MRLGIFLTALAIAIGSVASAQTYNEKTTVETKSVTLKGEVVRYDPGKVIVIRGADNKETSYTLSPSVTVPVEVQIGKNVTLFVEDDLGGAKVVQRVTTTTTTPEGATKTTTEETRREPSGETTTTTTTKIEGKVEAFTAGKSVTVLRSDGSRVTYTISPQSLVPEELEIGRTVVLVPVSPRESVVKTITIREQ